MNVAIIPRFFSFGRRTGEVFQFTYLNIESPRNQIDEALVKRFQECLLASLFIIDVNKN